VPGPLDEPPRHQGHQAHPPAREKPQITQMNADILFDLDRVGSSSTTSCRPCVISNAKAQRRKAHPPPPLNAETRSRRGAEKPSLSSFVRRGPGRPMTAGYCRAGQPLQERALGPVARPGSLRSRRAQASPLLFFILESDRACYQSNNMKERQNRRAKGTSAGEKRGSDERLRSGLASFSPATGDSRSPVVLPGRCGDTFQAQHHSLCASAPLRLCVFFFGRVGGSVPSVALWFY